jgi:hypothetical protein
MGPTANEHDLARRHQRRIDRSGVREQVSAVALEQRGERGRIVHSRMSKDDVRLGGNEYEYVPRLTRPLLGASDRRAGRIDGEVRCLLRVVEHRVDDGAERLLGGVEPPTQGRARQREAVALADAFLTVQGQQVLVLAHDGVRDGAGIRHHAGPHRIRDGRRDQDGLGRRGRLVRRSAWRSLPVRTDAFRGTDGVVSKGALHKSQADVPSGRERDAIGLLRADEGVSDAAGRGDLGRIHNDGFDGQVRDVERPSPMPGGWLMRWVGRR